MQKTVIIINGKGGVGKDTLCDAAGKAFKTENVSAITPVKEIAKACGWDGGKDAKGRKFLAGLKQLLIDYNDLPTRYLLSKYEEFINKGEAEILFVHIREPEQIEAFRDSIPTLAYALLVRSERVTGEFGNQADDGVEGYSYDYYYDNDLPFEEAKADFVRFLGAILDAAPGQKGD